MPFRTIDDDSLGCGWKDVQSDRLSGPISFNPCSSIAPEKCMHHNRFAKNGCTHKLVRSSVKQAPGWVGSSLGFLPFPFPHVSMNRQGSNMASDSTECDQTSGSGNCRVLIDLSFALAEPFSQSTNHSAGLVNSEVPRKRWIEQLSGCD